MQPKSRKFPFIPWFARIQPAAEFRINLRMINCTITLKFAAIAPGWHGENGAIALVENQR
jgi:hypothetical protein